VLDADRIADSSNIVYSRTKPEFKAETPPEPEPEAKPAPAPFVLDPSAAFDKVASIPVMGMGVPYPDSQLYPVEGDANLTFMSRDEDALITFIVLLTKPKNGRPTVKETTSLKDQVLAALSKATPGGYNVSENKLDNRNPIMAHFKATFNSSGVTRYVYAFFGAWHNETDNSNSIYTMILECPVELSDGYLSLFERIRASLTDV
ncbi:MAG: hypothetical protein LBJ61_02140, partial [Deltaproteobacteria bacterium]|jgi:hypothetical protein|nr:hypothetical protein [Deltaproteobacteria bacterium]